MGTVTCEALALRRTPFGETSQVAEFLTREVPGMAVPEPVLRRLRDAKSRDEQREVGIRVASESLEAALAHPRVKGAYVFPPFGRYEAILRVLKDSGARR